MTNTEKLVIKTINKPSGGGEEGLLEWFCEVFDLNGSGDIEPYLLKEIAGGSMKGEGVTSTQ